LLCGPILRIGFDIGNDKASFFTSKFIKDEAKKIGYQIIDDVHGLCFYEQYLPVKVVSGGSSIVIGNKPSRFSKVFKKMFDNNTRLSDKQMLALELYNLSYFESSKRARFITLISAVECLSHQNDRSKDIVSHINELVGVTKKSNLNILDKKKLLNNLNTLKIESISESCRMLVSNMLGTEKLKEFNSYYKIRSQILHKGIASSNVDIAVEASKLKKFMSALLVAEIFGDYNYLYDNQSHMHNSRHISHREIID
jgi:hypothetical protein